MFKVVIKNIPESRNEDVLYQFDFGFEDQKLTDKGTFTATFTGYQEDSPLEYLLCTIVDVVVTVEQVDNGQYDRTIPVITGGYWED